MEFILGGFAFIFILAIYIYRLKSKINSLELENQLIRQEHRQYVKKNNAFRKEEG